MLDDCMTNATLVCGGSEFKADKVILSEVSPYFRSAFSNGWTETTDSRVVLPTIHPKSMKTILECIGTGQIKRIPKNKEELQQLVEDADYLQFDELVRLVFGMLTRRQLTIKNFRELYDLSRKLNNNQFCASQVMAFLAENFCDLTKCSEFLFLSTDELKKILQQRQLQKHGTKLVLTGILLWTKCEKRRIVLVEDFLRTLEEYGWCPECLNCCIQENISKAWNNIITVHLQELLQMRNRNSLASHGTSQKDKLLVFGYSSSNQSIMSTFDKNTRKWVETRILPFELEDGMSIGAYGCHIYLFGGEKDVNDTQRDEEYDPDLYYEYEEYDEYDETSDGVDYDGNDTCAESCDNEEICEQQCQKYDQDVEFEGNGDEDQFFECVEYDESNDEYSDKYYDYFLKDQGIGQETLMPVRFPFSFFGYSKVKHQYRNGSGDAIIPFYIKVIMPIINVLMSPWSITKLISLFISTFDDDSFTDTNCRQIEYENDVGECYDDVKYDYQCYEQDEDGTEAVTCSEEWKIEVSGNMNNDDSYVEEYDTEAEETSGDVASIENEDSEIVFDCERESYADGSEEDGEEEHVEDTEDCDEEYEEEYGEELEDYDDYESNGYDEEYNELLDDMEGNSAEDNEDVVDVEYCRVYHNNIDEWNRLTVYCPKTNAIVQRAESPLTFSVCLAGAGVVGGCIYVVNGVNEHYAMVKYVQRFKPADYSCTLMASTNKAHSSPHVLPYDNGLYILGSCSRNDKIVEHYDVTVNQWTVVTHLPRYLDMCFATLCHKKLVVLRREFQTQLHVYDLATGSWWLIDYFGGPGKIEWVSANEKEGKSVLVVFDSTNIVYQYDMATTEWVTESKQNLNLKNCLFTCSI